MNILLTCAGRRNYLVRYFQEALSGKGAVYAIDSSPSASALHEADHALIVPPVTAPNYIEVLVDICRSHEIRLVLSLNDLELPLLAREKQRLLQVGTFPVVSEAEIIDLCFDKWATDRFLARIGVGRPKTYLSLVAAKQAIAAGELEFPVVVKPRWGTASLLIEYPQTMEELEHAYQLNQLRLKRTFLAEISATDAEKGILIQEMLPGKEYGLDVINDLEGRYVTTFVKQKLGMRSGETDKARTVESSRLVELGRQIGAVLGHVGNLDCDVFVSEEGRVSVLEMNPRFGGGYPFSHAAGANLPAALISWAEGKSPRKEWLEISPNIASAKCDRLVDVSSLGGRGMETMTHSVAGSDPDELNTGLIAPVPG